MDSFLNLIWHDGKFIGIEWHLWKVIGWVGNAIFFSRFFVQWFATEKQKKVVVPVSFWWISAELRHHRIALPIQIVGLADDRSIQKVS